MAEAEHLKSMGHQHVLAPEMRTPEGAWAVAHKLLHKAAMRMRAADLWAASIGLTVGFAVPKSLPASPRGDQKSTNHFDASMRSWKAELKLSECQDNSVLIAALSRLWASLPAEFAHPCFIGVYLGGLVPGRLHTLNLFDTLDEARGRKRLLEAMDALNNKYGLGTLAPATMLAALKAAPTRIAFRSIPELF
jgi:DNA polymerase-4